MSILNWYVLRGFLLAFFMSIGILTFAMTGANLIKVLDLVAEGASAWAFIQFVFYILPIVLTFTVPWAVLVAVMLVFGRLSADSEITAMRACGISIMQIVSPIMLVTVLLTGICLYLQVELGPPLQKKARSLLKSAVMEQPQSLFEPGRQIDFQNTMIYINDKEPSGRLRGIDLYVLEGGNDYSQHIAASYGELGVDEKKRQLTIKMYDCMIDNKQPGSSGSVERFFSKEFAFTYDYGKAGNSEKVTVRPKYMRVSELLGRIRMTKELNRDTTELEVELNQRIAFALSPIAFLLLGLPLAIRTSRRETSIGLFLSVILAGVFFLSIIMCESFSSYPKIYPQYLLWLPNIIFQVAGAIMTVKISRK
ncbi:MAG: LptF/LptG family permease [Lentisphaeria bacterium]|nr:LptF/LptG family permease [Lentisphaeria bacterium]